MIRQLAVFVVPKTGSFSIGHFLVGIHGQVKLREERKVVLKEVVCGGLCCLKARLVQAMLSSGLFHAKTEMEML